MPKSIIPFFLLISLSLPLFGDEVIKSATVDLPKITNPSAKLGNEMALLDNLIETTKQNLEIQRQLKNQLVEYIQLQKQYAENTQDKPSSAIRW